MENILKLKNLNIPSPYFWTTLKRFYSFYAHSHNGHIVLLFIGAVISGVLEVLGIIALYYMIRILIRIDALGQEHFVSKLFGVLRLDEFNQQVTFLGLSIAAIFIGKNLFIMAYYYFQHYTLRKWKTEISANFMRKYLNAPYGFLLGYNSSTILRNINSIVSSALNGFILNAFNFMANVISGIIILSIIYLKYLKISILIASILILATILQNFFLKKTSIAIGKERDRLLEAQNKNVYQGIHAIKETKVMGKESFFMEAFSSLNYDTVANDAKNMFIGRLPSHINEIVIILAIIIICVSVLTDPNHTTDSSMASLGVLAAIAFRIAPIMNRTLGTIQAMNKNTNSIEVMFSEIEKLDRLSVDTSKSRGALPFENTISFDNVSYIYPRTKLPAVSELSFTINKGEFVGVVGESGAGKSTVMDILLGLLEPTSGKVSVDGVSVDNTNLRSWQDKLSFVPQQIYLADDTLANNIGFGLKDEEISLQRVNEVIEKTRLSDLRNKRSEGVDFMIGENGKRLSGGQKQRLAIARALYHNTEILLLDEATSALDLQTEYEISKVLHEQAGEKTIIAIAHRLSTVYAADTIIFMDKGKIVDKGTFDELVNRNREFEKLARLAKIIS